MQSLQVLKLYQNHLQKAQPSKTYKAETHLQRPTVSSIDMQQDLFGPSYRLRYHLIDGNHIQY